MTRRVVVLAIALLVGAGATAVTASDQDQLIPCEWFPVDPTNPSGEWYLVDPDCEPHDAPRHDAIATFGPRVTLPPTDTVR